jgi:hypothetical protein
MDLGTPYFLTRGLENGYTQESHRCLVNYSDYIFKCNTKSRRLYSSPSPTYTSALISSSPHARTSMRMHERKCQYTNKSDKTKMIGMHRSKTLSTLSPQMDNLKLQRCEGNK